MGKLISSFCSCAEKATSHLLLEPDWQSIIQICDIICQGDCQWVSHIHFICMYKVYNVFLLFYLGPNMPFLQSRSDSTIKTPMWPFTLCRWWSLWSRIVVLPFTMRLLQRHLWTSLGKWCTRLLMTKFDPKYLNWFRLGLTLSEILQSTAFCRYKQHLLMKSTIFVFSNKWSTYRIR